MKRLEEIKASEKEHAEKVEPSMVGSHCWQYRDRAKERRLGVNPDYAEDEMLLRKIQDAEEMARQ